MDDILSQIIAYAPDRIDTETKARALVQGPRNMYASGQLVSNTVDGSRPGYGGDNVRKLRSGVEVSTKKTPIFKYPRKNFLGKTNYYKTPQITRTNIEGIPNDVGTKLARLQDGKQYQVSTKGKNYLFKTEKQAVDFYNKNVKKGSGAQIKDVWSKQSKELQEFFKDPKIYKRYYAGPLNASSIENIWLNLSAAQKRQAKQLLETKGKNIKEAAKLTKQGYTRITDLADNLGRTTAAELIQSMKNSKKFNKLFPNYLEGLITASDNTKWIKTTPSTLKKLKQWANDPQSKGLTDSTIKNVQTAYDDKKLMDYWKKWKPGTPIDQELVDSVHGKKGSANTMMQLGRTLQGKEPIDGVRVNKALGDKIIEAVRYKAKEFGEWHTAAYRYAKQDMDTFLPPGKSGTTFTDYYNLLTKSLKEVGLAEKGFQIDEINALRSGVRGGTQPYSVFSQVLEGKYNMGVKKRFDAENAKNQVKLNKALAMGDDETITVSKKKMNKKQYIDYVMKLQNDQIDNFFEKAPELKGKVNLVKFDLRDPRTVYGSRFDTFDKGVQNAILKNFKEIGYTVDVGKKALTQKELLKKLEAHGCKGKAAGGRILFSNGGEAITTCAKKGVTRFIDDLKKGNYSKATKDILKGGGQFIKGALNPMELLKLRNLIGPAAMGFMAAFEAGVITDDVIRQGTPLNESLANNWLTKAFLPYTKQYAEAKNLLETGKVPSNMKKYVKDVVTFNEMLMDMKGIEGRKDSRLVDDSFGMIDGTSMYTKKQEQKEDEALMKKAKTLTENVFTPGTAKALEMKSLQDEMEATRMAKKEFSPIFGFDKLKDVRTPGYTGFDYIPDEQPVDLRPITYQDAEYSDVRMPVGLEQAYMNKFGLKPRDSLSNYTFKGSDKNVLQELTDEYNKFQRQKEASQYPGYYGANEKFSEGGIASLNVKK